MNIGVDIDGVLADYFAYVRDVVRPHFSSFNETEYRVHEMFGLFAMDKNPYEQKGKSGVVKKFALDIHIDDAPHEVELLSSTIPIIIFDNPYNRECNPPNTHRAKNWAEVYEIINKLRA